MRRPIHGLSVIEVVVAFALLTAAGLGLIAAMTRLMMAQSTSSHQTIGRIIAESVMQETTLAGPASWPPVGSPGPTQTRKIRIGQNSELVEYSYQIRVEEVVPPVAMGKSDPALADMGTMWQVKVKIWWNQEVPSSGAVERGTQTIEVTRLTYAET